MRSSFIIILLINLVSISSAQTPWQLSSEIGWSMPFVGKVDNLDDRTGYGIGLHLDRYATRNKKLSLGLYASHTTVESEFDLSEDFKTFHHQNMSYGGNISESVTRSKRYNFSLALGGTYTFVEKKSLHIQWISKLGVSRISNPEYMVEYRFTQPASMNLTMYHENPLEEHLVNYHFMWLNGLRLLLHSDEKVRIFASVQHALIPKFTRVFSERQLDMPPNISDNTEFLFQLSEREVKTFRQTCDYHLVSINFGLMMNIFSGK